MLRNKSGKLYWTFSIYSFIYILSTLFPALLGFLSDCVTWALLPFGFQETLANGTR